MKFDFRTYIRGGEILNPNGRRKPVNERQYTRVVPTSDAVLTGHQPGDFVAAWALTMCMRDTLSQIESSFPNFTVTDRLVARGVSKKFEYDSPLAYLHWWQDRLEVLIALEKRLVDGDYASVAVEHQYAMAMVGAVEWYIQRHKCRPPGVGEGLHDIQTDLQERAKAEQSSSATPQANLPAIGTEQLELGDRLAVEALRVFEESSFSFLTEVSPESLQSAQAQEERERRQNLNKMRELGIKEGVEEDEIDEIAFGAVKVSRAVAPDGYRDEDRRALDRFKRYVNLAVPHVPPLKSTWVDPDYLITGQRIFAFGQLLFTSSFPNAESAKLREEELQAKRAKQEREQKEAEQRQKGGRFGM